MKGWKGWLFLIGIFYLFFLLWQLPAELCWQWLAPRSPAAARLQAGGIEGAWSKGRAAELQSGALHLSELTWSYRPLGLLAGRLEFALRAILPGESPVSAILILTPGRLRLRDLQGQVPAGPVGEAILPGLGLAGELQGRDLSLSFENGLPVAADGSLSWLNASISFPEPATLGNLELRLATESDLITATLKDLDGPVQTNILTRLRPDGNYELTGELVPRGQLPRQLASLLGFFGPPAADGRIRVQRTGRLAPIY